MVWFVFLGSLNSQVPQDDLSFDTNLLNPITYCAEQNVKKDKLCGRLNFINCITNY